MEAIPGPYEVKTDYSFCCLVSDDTAMPNNCIFLLFLIIIRARCLISVLIDAARHLSVFASIHVSRSS